LRVEARLAHARGAARAGARSRCGSCARAARPRSGCWRSRVVTSSAPPPHVRIPVQRETTSRLGTSSKPVGKLQAVFYKTNPFGPARAGHLTAIGTHMPSRSRQCSQYENDPAFAGGPSTNLGGKWRPARGASAGLHRFHGHLSLDVVVGPDLPLQHQRSSRSLTPGPVPPPRNSIPASSRARCKASIVDLFASDPFSILVTVLAATPAFWASSLTLHPTAARAIRSCTGVIGAPPT
jgi:hypothetical protein